VVDLVKVSDDDLRTLHPDRDPLAVAGGWARSGPGAGRRDARR
jgi:hypothetical protein